MLSDKNLMYSDDDFELLQLTHFKQMIKTQKFDHVEYNDQQALLDMINLIQGQDFQSVTDQRFIEYVEDNYSIIDGWWVTNDDIYQFFYGKWS